MNAGSNFTSYVGIDTGNSVVIYKQGAQSIKIWHVFQLHNLIVRQINGIKLVLSTTQCVVLGQNHGHCKQVHDTCYFFFKKTSYTKIPQWHPSFRLQGSCCLQEEAESGKIILKKKKKMQCVCVLGFERKDLEDPIRAL